MLAELQANDAITLPADMLARLGLAAGDMLEIIEDSGSIRLMPATIYPDAAIDGLAAELADAKKNIAAGKQPVFDSVDDMLDALDGD